MTPNGEKKLLEGLEVISSRLANIEALLRRQSSAAQSAAPPGGAQIPDINNKSEPGPVPLRKEPVE
jgi:hypothetical protein